MKREYWLPPVVVVLVLLLAIYLLGQSSLPPLLRYRFF